MRTTTAFASLRSSWLLVLCAPMLLPATAALAQEEGGADVIEEIVVTGVRRTIQDSIQLKRNSVEIVDGLNADEIGALPALSIGEALETVTGAATHRENGGATEVAIRGLGPYLGTTTVNVRESTNGSGNRAVNFSIFPSELFNAIAIHKTQSASYIEGAVSGQVQLTTRRPIEYGEQRVQFGVKGSAHPDDANIAGQSNGSPHDFQLYQFMGKRGAGQYSAYPSAARSATTRTLRRKRPTPREAGGLKLVFWNHSTPWHSHLTHPADVMKTEAIPT